MSDIVIQAEHLSKQYRIGAVGGLRRKQTPANLIWALDDVSFEVQRGEVLGIIGRNGAGKSTLLKILSRITRPTLGQVMLRGRVGSLLEVGTGFHPELTGRENIFLNGAILGMKRVEIRRKFDEIVEFSEIAKFIDTPVKRYSSGMFMRLAFAVAAHLEPEILLVDEVLAVGDQAFQNKCLGKMSDIAREGRTILFISHNISAIKVLCTRAILLENGSKTFDGEVLQAAGRYLKQKTQEEGKPSVRWNPSEAPAIPASRLVEVSLLNGGKQVGSNVSTEQPIQIRIIFEVIKEGAKVGTTVILHNSDGLMLFVSISNHEPNWHMRPRPRGFYRNTCEIPMNFLADGNYSVSVGLWQDLYEQGFIQPDVLHFTAHEQGYVRGDVPYDQSMKDGVVRPLLQWTSEQESEN